MTFLDVIGKLYFRTRVLLLDFVFPEITRKLRNQLDKFLRQVAHVWLFQRRHYIERLKRTAHGIKLVVRFGAERRNARLVLEMGA